ncbi:hypothetical protein JM84_2372 [Dokdonia sp. Hel_I_63]|uniref:hypothetical protein n=1 Tax=Dokdonia sp. Hel_I_63 TaxID=1249996 RepID=UPI00119B4A28|nr:hypothetical protein [Dokdonia sp. Hel_I_63]TVZ23447.1 hypothetical protein JM84_2372 [Dokdonia sp. Hel_I_63]
MSDKSYDLNKLFEFFEYWKKHTHPTEFYNEGWLLKVLVYAITDFGKIKHPLHVNKNEEFFSEGLLTSPFLKNGKIKRLAESHTHADGAIGNFEIGSAKNKGLLKLIGNKLNIFEAKINSGFSTGVTNASFYNQAARYVACIAETVDKAGKLETLDGLSLGFYLVVPVDQYEKKNKNDKNKMNLKELFNEKHILDTVEKRVDQYKDEDDYGDRKKWFETKFKPVLEKLVIRPLYYEDVIEKLEGYKYYDEIQSFYDSCKKYN